MKVMIVVTHLLGTGHLARALTLGRAFAQAGDQVTVVSGGKPVPHFDSTGISVVQLPPVQSDGTDFTRLIRDDGCAADDGYLQTRHDTVTKALADTAPDVVITELFPFGRRILRNEFRTLLDAAHAMTPRPLVLSSIRDILAPPSKPAKATFADDMVAQYYDGVLVHADPDIVTLERSWPVSNDLRPRLHYTGFVAPTPPDDSGPDHGAVLVSAGGGNVGDVIFAVAAEAAAVMPETQWRCLVGGHDARRARFAAHAPANMTIEPPRPDFRALLCGACVSVSMCGYNTALDVLQTGVRAVLVPFDDGGEVEQGLRAEALAAQTGISVLRQDVLSGAALQAAISAVRNSPRRTPRTDGMDGAARTVAIVHELAARLRA